MRDRHQSQIPILGADELNMTSSSLCRCCGSEQLRVLFSGPVLDRSVEYSECGRCTYVQTEDPVWLDVAYSDAINDSDTGILARNTMNRDKTLVTLLLLRRLDGLVVDFAGGYGLLVRMLRDAGVEAQWSDPHCENLFAKGFAYENRTPSMVTSFEAFEHFENPDEMLQQILRTGADHVLISTELIPVPAPAPADWWYYGADHGQHIGFFRRKTLEQMAQKRGLRLLSDGHSVHLFTRSDLDEKRWRSAMRISRYVSATIRKRRPSLTWEDHQRLIEPASSSS